MNGKYHTDIRVFRFYPLENFYWNSLQVIEVNYVNSSNIFKNI
ncbi:hypothetical protein ABIE06_004342 [Pantoea dispersa]